MLGTVNTYKAKEEPVTLTQSSDVNAWVLLDQLDVCLQELKEQIDIMNNMLAGVLTPDFEGNPVPGPRISSSNLTSRIAAQADFVDDLTRTISNIKGRLSV